VDAGSGSALKSIKLTAVATFVCSDVPSEEPMLLALDIVYIMNMQGNSKRTDAQEHDDILRVQKQCLKEGKCQE